MEFTSVLGSCHLMIPIGYNQVRKMIISRFVRSAVEQWEIHKLALLYESPLLYIPQLYNLETAGAYTMEQFYDGKLLKDEDYYVHSFFMSELERFKRHMIACGYWPFGFKIFHDNRSGRYILIDFSRFGSIDRGRVRFPKIQKIFTLEEAEDTLWTYYPVTQPVVRDELLDDGLEDLQMLSLEDLCSSFTSMYPECTELVEKNETTGAQR
jgi:hypothetical protein